MAKVASIKSLCLDCLDMYEEIRVSTNDLLNFLDAMNLPPSTEPYPNIDAVRNRLRNLNSNFERYLDAIEAQDAPKTD